MKLAMGVPKVDIFGEPTAILGLTAVLGKNQTLMYCDVHSVA